MSNAALEKAIEAAWEARDNLTPASKGEARDAIEATLDALEMIARSIAKAPVSDPRQPCGVLDTPCRTLTPEKAGMTD
jgi:hypothetical protein